MGVLVKQIGWIEHVKTVIEAVLSHFDSKGLNADLLTKMSAASDLAFSDRLLFEKFESWVEDHYDESFLFHINRFFEKRNQKPLDVRNRDLSLKREEIENAIKESVKGRQNKIVGQRIVALAVERNLLTNEQLGTFLGVSA